MKLIDRPIYLQKLKAREMNGAIKVITGVRRCGKSILLFDLFYSYLLTKKIDPKHIIKISLDDPRFIKLRDAEKLTEFIYSKITDNAIYYLFIDEVQLCNNFESALNGLNKNHNLDIYVTGSNSKFLSSDVITEFRGRGDEIRVFPLSFKEYFCYENKNFTDTWNEYYVYGGMPFLITKQTFEEKNNYLKSLFEFTYVKDILERNRLKSNEVLETLIDILASSIGALINPKKIADTFNSKGVKTSSNVINEYINCLVDSFLISRAQKYDVKGRKYISTPFKYYFVDAGLRNARLGFRQLEENHLMENIIYNELLMRGFAVDIGMVTDREVVDSRFTHKQLEVDFICNKGFKKYYIQSALVIADKEKMMQESKPLLEIKDAFRKIIIVKDAPMSYINETGIEIIKLEDFLLNPDLL